MAKRTNGISQSLENRSTAQWFNVAAFALAPLYSFGNAARNSVTGPPGFTLDFSGHKDSRIREGHALQFRIEAFSFLSHPRAGPPTANLSSPQVGRITSTSGSMRQMQFVLKYTF